MDRLSYLKIDYTWHEVEPELWLSVELLNRIVCINVAWWLDAHNVSVLCEHFVTNRVLELILLIFAPVHFNQVSGL